MKIDTEPILVLCLALYGKLWNKSCKSIWYLHFILDKCHCKWYRIGIKMKKHKKNKDFSVFLTLVKFQDNSWTNQWFCLFETLSDFKPAVILTVKRVHCRIFVLEVNYAHSLHSISPEINYCSQNLIHGDLLCWA